jgi:hypothetical protein
MARSSLRDTSPAARAAVQTAYKPSAVFTVVVRGSQWMGELDTKRKNQPPAEEGNQGGGRRLSPTMLEMGGDSPYLWVMTGS